VIPSAKTVSLERLTYVIPCAKTVSLERLTYVIRCAKTVSLERLTYVITYCGLRFTPRRSRTSRTASELIR
jgi:hypothetical protein